MHMLLVVRVELPVIVAVLMASPCIIPRVSMAGTTSLVIASECVMDHQKIPAYALMYLCPRNRP